MICPFCDVSLPINYEPDSTSPNTHPRNGQWDHLASAEHQANVYAFWHDSGAFRLTQLQTGPLDFVLSKKRRQRLEYKLRKGVQHQQQQQQQSSKQLNVLESTALPAPVTAPSPLPVVTLSGGSMAEVKAIPRAMPMQLSVIQVPADLRRQLQSQPQVAPWKLSPAPGVTLVSNAVSGSGALHDLAEQYRRLLKAAQKNPKRIGAAWANMRLRQLAELQSLTVEATPASHTPAPPPAWLPGFSGMWSDGSISRSRHRSTFVGTTSSQSTHRTNTDEQC